MTWIDTAIPLLRSILQDVSNTPDYSTSQLTDVLFSAAYLVQSEIDFNYTYVIDIVLRTLTPDPVTNDDKSFVSMTVYKAALFILNSELKTAATQSVSIKDGPSTIDVKGRFKEQKNRYDLMLQEYDKVKLAIKMGDLHAGQSILTPYTVDNGPTYIWS